jgi:hypothetical protein
MTRTLSRTAATFIVPLVLLSTATACGSSDAKEPAAKVATTAPATTAPTTEPTMPSLGDVPDPRKDPEGFQKYLTSMYKKSGLTDTQASCLSKAFMDNIDLDKITDASAVTSMMGTKKMTQAITACM